MLFFWNHWIKDFLKFLGEDHRIFKWNYALTSLEERSYVLKDIQGNLKYSLGYLVNASKMIVATSWVPSMRD